MTNALFEELKASTILLTPNQRLAATLIKQYNQAQIKKGLKCWPSFRPRPWKTWIQELWTDNNAKEMDGAFLPLSANQELILWEEIIAARPESEVLLKLSDLALQAKSAWTTLKLWRTDFKQENFAFTENSRHFQEWATQFEARCQKVQWLDNASLTECLIEKIKQQKIDLPARLVLLNFTELAPQHLALLKACEEQGARVEHQKYQATQTEATLRAHFQIGLNNEETEIETLARWAKKIHEQEPQARIGCIAANLEEKREMILAAFNRVFDNPAQYNISAGRTLASYPVIQNALQLLKLSSQILSAETMSALLHSPFLGDADKERYPRIQLDSHLRRRNLSSLAWDSLLQDPQLASCPLLLSRLNRYHAHRQAGPAFQSISPWFAQFAKLLEILGWPGEQSLNSTEYQVVKCWLDLLLECGPLEQVLSELSYSKALHYLTLLATLTYFQPESPEAPIQILGQLEGAGLPFDYLWIMGLDDTAWPPAPSPNPFIPHELQKNLGMPNASADRQLAYSRLLMQQYQNAAPQVYFSYSQHKENEELRPSPLLHALPALTLNELALAPIQAPTRTVFLASALEPFQDEQAAPLGQNEKLQGGIALFEMQAACPFKAFAVLRLGARPLEEPEAGLPAKKRGSVLHKALELFWREAQDQETLKSYSAEMLQNKIHHVLSQALSELAPFIRADSLYYKLVKQRFNHLLGHWFELEKSRPPFRVAAIEQEKEIRLDQFSLRLRIDRIDELTEGGQLMIDYKTKKDCNPNAWFGTRPDEPQLPFYCITTEMQVLGLAFAQLYPNKTEIKGLAQKALDIPGIKTFTEKTKADASSWEEQREQWRINLTQLFRDFQSGQAKVDPKKEAETCRYCDLKTFCRIHEEGFFHDEPTDL